MEYNASVANKTPIFVVQFLKDDTRYVMLALEDIPKVNEYLQTGEITSNDSSAGWVDSVVPDKPKRKKKPKIKSDANAREEYNKMMEEEREKRRWQK